jgi:inhibitor of cysteine peptidase
VATTVIDVPDGTSQTCRIGVGDRVELRLPETPTTGYRWHADPGPLLRLVDDTYAGQTNPRGAGGVRVLTFEATGAGRAEVSLVKRRAWGDSSAVAQASVAVEIAGAGQ